MKNGYIALIMAISTMCPTSLLAAGLSPSTNNPTQGTTSRFQLTEKTQVPGHTLNPGSYAIVVLDRLSDRVVLRITSEEGKEESTFLAVPPTATFPGQATAGPVSMAAKGNHTTALRGYVFADGTRTEFVYRKADAVLLAKQNDTTIVAVDPASEGRPDKDDLSPTDRQLVALWMLTPTVVGKTAAIEAQRYQAVAEAMKDMPQRAMGTVGRTSNSLVAGNSGPRPHSVTNRIKVLPHTASSQPIVLLIGLLSAFASVFLNLRRRVKVGPR